MTERRGDTLLFHTPPVIAAQAAVGGKKESEGPLAAGFDELTTDNRLGQRSWEAAEKQLQLRAARLCLQKASLRRAGRPCAGRGLAGAVHRLRLCAAGAGRALCGAVRGLQHIEPRRWVLGPACAAPEWQTACWP